MPKAILKGGLDAEPTVYDAQIALEAEQTELGVERYRKLAKEAVERGEGAMLKPAERLLLWWFEPMVKAIRREQREIRAGKPGFHRDKIGAFMLAIDAERLAVIALHETISRCMGDPDSGSKVVVLALAIGRAMEAEIHSRNIPVDFKEEFRKFNQKTKRMTPRKLNKWTAQVIGEQQRWEKIWQVKAGTNLIFQLVGHCSVAMEEGEFNRAFLLYKKWERGKTIRYLRMNRIGLDIIEAGHRMRQHLRPRYMPMICTPMPWTKYREGGYVRLKTQIIRKAKPDQKVALDGADLSTVRRSLNAVSKTPWRVNKKLLAVQVRAWRNGGKLGGLPDREPKPMPEKPADIDTNEEALKDWKRRAAFTHMRNSRERLKCNDYGQFTLPQAERFAKHEQFWLPHSLDFRGRAYPIPLYLNHHGHDTVRGLLEFARGKRATVRGEYWLRVHAANCFGYDKCSFDDRVQWSIDNEKEILESAADPEKGGFWAEADKPWQFLAACLEIAGLKADGSKHEMHIPAQVDGSCNGLQHYAALGRDMVGAAAVNLIPADAPSDVYSHVAEKTAAILEAEAKSGISEARTLTGKASRKVVKQTVMTSVYGVTAVGARMQVAARLKEIGFTEKVGKLAAYLSKIVLRALAGVCVAAVKHMDWLASVARVISEAGRLVSWETPLGFPVVQPYRNVQRFRVCTVIGHVSLPFDNSDAKVAIGKQVTGFAPNFIHSIDASHMLMTGESMARHGYDFAEVHDSYWSNPADVDELHRVTRQTFVALHEIPIVEKLYKSFIDRHPDLDIPSPPERGEFNLSVTLDSRYFFA